MTIKEYGTRSDRPEDVITAEVYQYLHNKPGRPVIFHIANERKTSMRHGGKLKAMGVRKGLPDLQMVSNSGRAYFIENKTSNRGLSNDQIFEANRLIKRNAVYVVIVSKEGAEEFWQEYKDEFKAVV